MPGEEGPFQPTDGEADPPPAIPSPVPLEPVGTGDFGWDPRSPAPVTPVPPPPETVSVEERKAALAQAIAGQIAQGYRVDSQSDFQAVVVKGKRPSHLLHLVLTIITLGLWAIVWIVLSLTMHVHRRLVTVNELGNTTVQHVKN
jgi:hypothetical protein